MFASAIALGLVAASTVFAAPYSNSTLAAKPGNSTTVYKRCGTEISQAKVAEVEAKFKAEAAIPVHWHVIAKDKTPWGGWLSDKQIRKQIDVLNDAYARTGLKFKLESIDRTIDPQWFYEGCPATGTEANIKRALRKGDRKHYNVYSNEYAPLCALKEGLLGFSAFPWEWDQLIDGPILDGSVVHWGSLPNGPLLNYDLGYTLVHEFGHWAGLYHTFQGGCGRDGDFVDDTPDEAGSVNGCPIGLDSCPGRGIDSIHNYMAWTDDSCMREFTRGQIKRMAALLKQYRNIKVTIPFW
ncbi:Metalloprotease [Cristinia sonorae]|uniref:Metalloprotease n=1 Tax=Cristinia sonorae TaxID=1940300 RepID=A0A8K0XN78_9AGAR|nr:Metalloprotease [Cristinia sonorae]